MKSFSQQVIKTARDTKTKILIADKNGKPKMVTPNQMEKMLKKES